MKNGNYRSRKLFRIIMEKEQEVKHFMMKKTVIVTFLIVILMLIVAGCQQNTSSDRSDELDHGVSAIEDAMSQGVTDGTAKPTQQEELC